MGEELREFRAKPTEDKYKYLLIDGLWVHLKEKSICNRPICYTHKLRDVSKSIRHKAKNRREMMFQASKIYKYDFSDDKNFISTTNHLERELEEIRRRIKVKGILNRNKALLFGYMVS